MLLVAFTIWMGTKSVAIFTVRVGQEAHRLVRAVLTQVEEEVRLIYHHSVEKSPVEGVFVIAEGPSLRIRETRMASVGTGLPNTAAERTRREGEWIVVDEGMKPLDDFSFRFMDLNRTQLMVADNAILLEGLRSGSALYFNVESIRRFRWWLWRVAGIDWRPLYREQDAATEKSR